MKVLLMRFIVNCSDRINKKLNMMNELKFLKRACELAGVGYWILDLDNEGLFWSEEVFHIHKQDPLKYKPTLESALEYYHIDDRQYVSDLIEKCIESGTAFEFKLRIIQPDGGVCFVQSKAECLYEPSGRVSHIFGIFKNIDKEIKEKYRVKLEEIAHKTHIDASGDGYWDWHIQKDYEYMSPRFWEILGYALEEKKHKTSEWKSCVFDSDLKLIAGNYERHIQAKGQFPYEQEIRCRHKDGSKVTILRRGKVIEWDENAYRYYENQAY